MQYLAVEQSLRIMGTEDATHLRGCGGWPSVATRPQWVTCHGNVKVWELPWQSKCSGRWFTFFNPSMIFLCETKQNFHIMNQLRAQFGYQKCFNVLPVGLLEGLSLWWKHQLTVEIVSSSKFIIDTAVSSSSDGWWIHYSFLNGPPHYEDKQPFWESSMHLGRGNSEALMVCGDMNELMWCMES